MKNLVLITTLCMASVGLKAQQAKPFRDANTVTIQTQDSATVALRKLGQALVGQGYTIDKMDSEFLTIRSNARHLEAAATDIALTIQAVATRSASSQLRLTGSYTFSVMGNPSTGTAQYTLGGPRSGNRTAFTELEKVAAAAYSGNVLSYEKR